MTLNRLLLVTILLGIAPPLGRAVAGPDTPARSCREASPSEITALLDRWQAAVANGDADAIAEFYADDAILLPAMSEAPRNGKAAIRAYFAEFVGRHPLPTTTMRSVMVGCGMASEMGAARYRLTGARKGTRTFIGGRYSTVLTESEGRWLIVQQNLSLIPQLNRASLFAR